MNFTKKPLLFLCLLLPCWQTEATLPPDLTGDLQLTPAAVTLTNVQRPHSILVRGRTKGGYDVDLSLDSTFRSRDETIAKVDATGWITPVANGQATITAQAGERVATVAVTVQLPERPVPASFRQDVMPVLSKAGCNAGACHGYSLGKNGFKLSLRGADPEPDYLAIVRDSAGRRVNLQNPAASLIVSKARGEAAHEGGTRFLRGSLADEIFVKWVTQGCPSDVKDKAEVVGVRMIPDKLTLKPGDKHRIQLIAEYADGTRRDVTRLGV